MIAGIVCEYNPFHNGHLYHINEVKKSAKYVVCAISGNFVQRGECAFVDKWSRARTAVECGADIVLDLPVPWSCASAETFARGGVGLLTAFGIDTLSFGSETDDLNLLISAADFISSKKVTAEIKEYMSCGMSFPSALSKAAKFHLSDDALSVLLSPNSTLASEYIKAAKFLGEHIDYMPVKRVGAAHDSYAVTSHFTSASNIRQMGVCDEIRPLMPEIGFSILKDEAEKGFAPCLMKTNERAILSHLRSIPAEEYPLYISDDNGLQARIRQSINLSTNLDSLYLTAKSKNYTHARVRREILGLYLGIERNMSEGVPPYIRVLAASKKGLTLLSAVKNKSALPIVTKHSESAHLCEKAKAVYDLQCSSTDKFALMSKKIRPCGLEQKNSIFIGK